MKIPLLLIVLTAVVLGVGSTLAIMNNSCKSSHHAWCGWHGNNNTVAGWKRPALRLRGRQPHSRQEHLHDRPGDEPAPGHGLPRLPPVAALRPMVPIALVHAA